MFEREGVCFNFPSYPDLLYTFCFIYHLIHQPKFNVGTRLVYFGSKIAAKFPKFLEDKQSVIRLKSDSVDGYEVC